MSVCVHPSAFVRALAVHLFVCGLKNSESPLPETCSRQPSLLEGFSSPVVPQEGCDLALVETDVELVDSRTRASVKHLHQVLNLHSHHQAQGVALKEQLTCVSKQIPERVSAENRGFTLA